MRPGRRLAALLCGVLACASVAAETDPLRLLEKMNHAVRSLDYEGRFVVLADNRLDALYIVHRVIDGAEKERVVSLTGEPKEIIRSDEAVACLVPGRESPINVGRRVGGRSFSPLAATDGKQLARHYRFSMLKNDRVAGRDAYQVLVEPRDKLRFGYRVAIDRQTGLPLGTAMLDASLQTRSQVMFVEILIGEGVTPIERDISALQLAKPDPADWALRKRLAPASWVFHDLPSGFQLNTYRRSGARDGVSEREHYIFSDGLATVSVYVQEAHADGGWSGVSRHGAANAVGRSLSDHEVVVIGEVPVETLEIFAQGIRSAR